jgi:hypothetical protein
MVRRIVLNLLEAETETGISVRGRRKRVGWDDAYREEIPAI